jgi:flagellin-specific chaperone FliS
MPSLHDDKSEVLFIDTYPGIITAFDVLFKADTFEELQARLTSLYNTCYHSKRRADLTRKLDEWSEVMITLIGNGKF